MVWSEQNVGENVSLVTETLISRAKKASPREIFEITYKIRRLSGRYARKHSYTESYYNLYTLTILTVTVLFLSKCFKNSEA